MNIAETLKSIDHFFNDQKGLHGRPASICVLPDTVWKFHPEGTSERINVQMHLRAGKPIQSACSAGTGLTANKSARPRDCRLNFRCLLRCADFAWRAPRLPQWLCLISFLKRTPGRESEKFNRWGSTDTRRARNEVWISKFVERRPQMESDCAARAKTNVIGVEDCSTAVVSKWDSIQAWVIEFLIIE